MTTPPTATETETLTMQQAPAVSLEEQIGRALQRYNTAALESQNAAAELIMLAMRARDELAAIREG